MPLPDRELHEVQEKLAGFSTQHHRGGGASALESVSPTLGPHGLGCMFES